MYHFFKKHFIDLSSIGVDLHNHILPNIDDGSKDIATSLLLRSKLHSWGIKHSIYTPHIYKDIYPNNRIKIEQSYSYLMRDTQYNSAYFGDTFAAEYMLDEFLKEEIEKKEKLLCVKKNLLLIELPVFCKSPLIEPLIFELFLLGYQPIIAHPERYVYYDFKDYIRLKEIGCLFQINYLSLASSSNKIVKKNAEKLLRTELVDYISTDLHHLSQLEGLSGLLQGSTWRKFKNYPFKNIDLIY